MSITDKANIRPSNNNVILQTFKKPVPVSIFSFSTKAKAMRTICLLQSIPIAVNIVPLYCQESAVNTQNKKGVNEGPHTNAEESSQQNAWPP